MQTSSLAGRVTRAKSLLNYNMQIVDLPRSIYDDIYKDAKTLFGETMHIKGKMHMVAWSDVYQPKIHGGLRLKVSKEVNLSSMM